MCSSLALPLTPRELALMTLEIWLLPKAGSQLQNQQARQRVQGAVSKTRQCRLLMPFLLCAPLPESVPISIIQCT